MHKALQAAGLQATEPHVNTIAHPHIRRRPYTRMRTDPPALSAAAMRSAPARISHALHAAALTQPHAPRAARAATYHVHLVPPLHGRELARVALHLARQRLLGRCQAPALLGLELLRQRALADAERREVAQHGCARGAAHVSPGAAGRMALC